MVKELSQLNDFIIESVNPDRLAAVELTDKDFINWSEFISGITRSLNVYINAEINFHAGRTARKLFPLLNALTDLINKTWSYAQKKRFKSNPASRRILNFYKYTCERLEDLLIDIRKHALFNRLRVSNFMRFEVNMQLKFIHKALLAKLSQGNISGDLFKIVPDLYRRRFTKKGLTWFDVQDITDGITHILGAEISDSNALFEALVAIDFDYIEVLHYQVELWRADLLNIPDIRDQIEYLVNERHKVAELVLLSKKRRSVKNQLAYDLGGYLNELEQFLRQILSMHVAAAQDAALVRSEKRFPISLSVPQLALFLRLQIERGILPRENLSQLFKFFADHFYTANARFISPENLQKKSTDIEFSTAQKMKGQLIGMINWLNTNYNLANYS